MNPKKIEEVLEIPLDKLAGIPKFYAYCELGDGVEFLGEAPTVGEALLLVHTRAFEPAEPIEPDVAFEELAGELTHGGAMERTTNAKDLVYLAEVVDERPELRLIVAWEAAPPLQDAAVGIFAPKPN